MPSSPPPVRACLFDMDGLLIDSEDLIFHCRDEVLKSYGRPPLPWHIKAQLQGRSKADSDRIFVEFTGLEDLEEYQKRFGEWKDELFPTCGLLPGVVELLDKLSRKREGEVQVALCTSSAKREFDMKTRHLAAFFDRHFSDEKRVLGDDPRIGPGKHKPEPDVWLVALDSINKGRPDWNVRPEECLVFEDSIPGVVSGLNAGMQVLWCPHPGLLKELEVNGNVSGCMPEGELGEKMLRLVERAKERERTSAGQLTVVRSLEQFSWKDFGVTA